MKNQQKLVLQHLEDIFWKVLEEYPKIIKNMIKGKWGVYALYKRNKLYYVGLANNLMNRLQNHLKDRHHGAWDRFSVYLTIKSLHIKELESLLIRVTDPPGNKIKGKFLSSKGLRPELNKEMTAFDADRRAGLIGGVIAQRRQKSVARQAGGRKSLEGIFSKRVRLKSTYKGKTFFATLRKDGKISYKNKLYPSPTSVAKIITGRKTISGWNFWRYKNGKNQWVKLTSLKK